MTSFKTTVSERGTITVKDHEGYVHISLAGKEVEVLCMPTRWLASCGGHVYTVQPYTGQCEQGNIFE